MLVVLCYDWVNNWVVVMVAGKLTHNQKRFLILRGFSRASNFHQMAHWFIDQKLYCILALKYSIGLHCQRQGSKKCLLFNFSLLSSINDGVPFWKFTRSEDTTAIDVGPGVYFKYNLLLIYDFVEHIFSSNQIVHKILFSLGFWASDL